MSEDRYASRHPSDPDPYDPGFCYCGLGVDAWVHTDTTKYVERPLTAEVWNELRGGPARAKHRGDPVNRAEIWMTDNAVLYRDQVTGEVFDLQPDETYPELPDDAVRLVPALEQTYEWGWRRTWDKPDDVVIAFSEDDARSRLNFLHNAVVTRRPVGSWETVEEASDAG